MLTEVRLPCGCLTLCDQSGPVCCLEPCPKYPDQGSMGPLLVTDAPVLEPCPVWEDEYEDEYTPRPLAMTKSAVHSRRYRERQRQRKEARA